MIRTQTTVKHVYFFFFNDTATTEIYTLSLHDALPIYFSMLSPHRGPEECGRANPLLRDSAAIRVLLFLYYRVLPVGAAEDRKSTRLNSVTPISRMPSSA